MHDLRESRQRIVQTGHAERRSLEHDLHDGAQQRLLALSYDLRVASAAAGERHELRSLPELAGAEAQRSLELLRELAHGIYPAILGEAGLGAALASFADAAPIPVELDVGIEGRVAGPAETSAYLVAIDAVDTAADAGATFARVRGTRRAESSSSKSRTTLGVHERTARLWPTGSERSAVRCDGARTRSKW